MIASKLAASAPSPEPFAIARSMLSFGIEYDLAFSIAAESVALFAGSAPPSFAATMIARVSFENSFPRLASAAPFLCLIDDHLLCPDKITLPYEVEKQLVDPRVAGELRVECGDEEAPLARQHRMPVDLGQHLDARPRLLDPRGADEDGAQRPLVAGDGEVGLERRDLTPEGVPTHGDVDEAEVVAVEHDHPGARPEDGRLELPQRLVEAVEAHQPRE